MPNYSKIWASLATRAVKQGSVDADTFLQMAEDVGMGAAEVQRRLLEDLDNDGPIFGKFLRSLSGAASRSVMAAERQGALAGMIKGDEELSRLLDLADVDDAIEEADPDSLEEIEEAVDDQEFTWVATLKKTCYLCLPLHGKTRTMGEWRELGFLPETMHDGWNSVCHCVLVPVKAAKAEPLVRMAERGTKKTARAVGQSDLDRARAAVLQAQKTEEGRRQLRLLGETLDEE